MEQVMVHGQVLREVKCSNLEQKGHIRSRVRDAGEKSVRKIKQELEQFLPSETPSVFKVEGGQIDLRLLNSSFRCRVLVAKEGKPVILTAWQIPL
jgi:hypothetical protein